MKLPVELFLALRYLIPRRNFVSVISILSILGVMISVCVLIVVLSVMAGVRQNLDQSIIGFNAHITVASGQVIYSYDKILPKITQDPGVEAASGFIRGPVLALHQGRSSYIEIKSAPSEGDDPVMPLKKYLVKGDYELRGQSVLVGYQWARQNFAFPGDEVELIGPAPFVKVLNQKAGEPRLMPLPDTLIIRGVFRTGQFDYDQNFFLVSTEEAQHLYLLNDPKLGEGIQGISVRVKNPDDVEDVKERLNRILEFPMQARTWKDDNYDLFTALATERVTMSFVLFMVMVVAAFGLCTTLITITVQKSREIGLMKALGASDLQVCSVFLCYGTVVGILGASTGVLMSLLILQEINHVRDWLLYQFHIEVFAPSVYGATKIPWVLNPQLVILTGIAALMMCLLAALIPAMNAAKLSPARALRYE